MIDSTRQPPILAADANLSALDKLEAFLESNATEQPQSFDESIINAAFNIGGATLAHAHRIYLSWFEHKSSHTIQTFDPDWEKQRKQGHQYCDCGLYPLSNWLRLITGESWTLSYNYKTQQIYLFDERSRCQMCTTETLEQLFVSHLLSDWILPDTYDYIPNVWLAQDVLDNSSQWELLWYRPSFIHHKCIIYLHTSKQMLLICPGQYDAEPFMYVGKQNDLIESWLAKTISPSHQLLRASTKKKPTVEQNKHCDKCMGIPF